MKKLTLTFSALAAISMSAWVDTAHAQIIISEVAPFGSGTVGYAADWFELTNTGPTGVNISGWKMDDNSNAFSAAVSLLGVNTIAAGQSVVFLEAAPAAAAATNAAFTTFWFGASAPAGLLIGNYSGSGVGLSTAADAVNIFDASGTLVTRVNFGANSGPFTFDNSAGINSVVGNPATDINTFSAVGTHGAFMAANSIGSVGSPGVLSVPEAEGYAMALAGLSALGVVAFRRRV